MSPPASSQRRLCVGCGAPVPFSALDWCMSCDPERVGHGYGDSLSGSGIQRLPTEDGKPPWVAAYSGRVRVFVQPLRGEIEVALLLESVFVSFVTTADRLWSGREHTQIVASVRELLARTEETTRFAARHDDGADAIAERVEGLLGSMLVG